MQLRDDESEKNFSEEQDDELEVVSFDSGPRRSYLSLLRRGVVVAVVAALAFAAGVVFEAHANGSGLSNLPIIGDGLAATPDQSADLSDFWKAWNVLQTQYVQTHASTTIPDSKKKIFGAIEGLTASYGDPYTVFFPPQEAKIFQDNISGSFAGIGAEIGIDKNNVLVVIAPLKGTPAEKAGLKPGDEILSINGQSTEGMSTDEAVDAIRGPKGTVVTFIIARNGKSLSVPVTRDTVNIPTIDYSLDKQTGIYTIALYTFTANSGDLFDQAFAAFKASGSKKLIIDLRGNPGGYLDAAVAIASHFLPKDTTIVTEDYKGKQPNDVHVSTGTLDVPQGTKVAVLIDQGSASASEILSGALQDNKAATLIGTRSFGKGSVQQLVDIDGGALKVTVARWLTPSGRSISDGGLTPDINVTRTQEDAAAGKDPQRDRAIQFLTTGQ